MCDCETPKASMTITRRARVEHQCCECGDAIKPGESYEYTSGVWDSPMSFKTCARCAGVRDFYNAECLSQYDCYPCFGRLWDEVADYVSGEVTEGIRLEFESAAREAGYLVEVEA